MPLPMVHLAVAVRLHNGQLPSADYLLGCLAPDAIHMRPGAGREQKRATHLFADEGSPAGDPLVHAFVDRMLQQAPGMKAFIEGYAVHLLTDRLWFHQLAMPFYSWAPAGSTPLERRSLYYLETDQVDFNLFYRMPWREDVWNSLASARPPEFPPYLSADEIGMWQQRTLGWFGGLKQEPKIQPVFFTDEVVSEFIDQAAGAIRDQFLF